MVNRLPEAVPIDTPLWSQSAQRAKQSGAVAIETPLLISSASDRQPDDVMGGLGLTGLGRVRPIRDGDRSMQPVARGSQVRSQHARAALPQPNSVEMNA